MASGLNHKLLVDEARKFMGNKQFDMAFALMATVWESQKNSIPYLHDLAECSFRVKQYEVSERAAARLVDIDPSRPAWKVLLGRVLVSSGNPDRAKEVLLEASSNREQEGAALRWLIEVGKMSGDGNLERQSAERIVQLHNAGEKLPVNALDRAHQSLGRLADGISMAGMVDLSMNVRGALVHKTLGIKVADADMLTDRIRNSFKTGTYEHWESEAAIRVIKAGDRVLELGGGVGFVSAVVGAKAAKVASYHVIEADPRLKKIIETTHQLNGISGFTVETCMVSTNPAEIEKGTAQFALAGNFTASSAKRLNVGRREISVPVRSLDEVLKEHVPNVLICDIEGSELDLVDGDLGSFRAIMMEIHPDVFGLEGVAQIFRRLTSQGFAYDIKNSNGAVVTFAKVSA